MITVTKEFITKLRTDLHMSYTDFARLFGVTQQTSVNWESGRSFPSEYVQAGMLQLRYKVDSGSLKDHIAQNSVSQLVKTLLITGGILAVLNWIFSKD
jgi:transcriptional regulator with XRE-family HTH domain